MNAPAVIDTLPLTERQEQLWRFIASCARSPTFEEMAHALDVTVGAQISRLVQALEDKGFVRRVPGRRRSVVAVDPRFSDMRGLCAYSDEQLRAELERRSRVNALREGFSPHSLPWRQEARA